MSSFFILACTKNEDSISKSSSLNQSVETRTQFNCDGELFGNEITIERSYINSNGECCMTFKFYIPDVCFARIGNVGEGGKHILFNYNGETRVENGKVTLCTTLDPFVLYFRSCDRFASGCRQFDNDCN